jgi:hypothetical protein
MGNIFVSFDFDGTLATKHVQRYAKELVDKGLNVHVVTRRYEKASMYLKNDIKNFGILNLEEEHKYLFDVCEEVGIKKENIHFMNMSNKELFFIENSHFIWHLDDDNTELREINSSTCVKGISVYGQYKHKCDKIIQIANSSNHDNK